MSLSRAQRVARYGGRAPRYTSYPTANHFHAMGPEEVEAAMPGVERRVSVYAHIPYCTKLCWYCGCNTTIRRDRSIGQDLVDGLLAELELVRPHLPDGLELRQLALGGGTPNFLTDDAMERWVRGLERVIPANPETVRSVELDPRTVEAEQLETLTNLGFTKFSLGVQTLHDDVQKAVNRPLAAARLWDITQALRRGGATSINLDLMVGLPLQTVETLDHTLAAVQSIRPERIAVFQYAHMPRLRPAQKLLERHGLPGVDERDAMFQHITRVLCGWGYERIGFDHFALPVDPLAIALREGRLERNFQGFTDDDGVDLLAFGPSAIGRIGGLFYQNDRDVIPWRESVDAGRLPVVRGLLSSDEDLLLSKVIMDLMCHNRTRLDALGTRRSAIERELERFVDDGLVVLSGDTLTVTEDGHDFVRAIAAVFDARLDRSAHATVA